MGCVGVSAKVVVEATQTKQAQRSDAKAHDGTAVKGDIQRGCSALLIGRNGSAHVRLGGGEHAEVARRGGRNCARDKCNCCVRAQRGGENTHHQYSGKGQQQFIFTVHEDHGTNVNLLRDTRDFAFASGGAGHHGVN